MDRDTITIDQVIDDAVSQLIGDFSPLRIILFGSRATGSGNSDSDIDLLVVMPNGTDRRQAAIEMHRKLRDLPIPKDIVVTTPAEIAVHQTTAGSVLAPALQEGRVLYERL